MRQRSGGTNERLRIEHSIAILGQEVWVARHLGSERNAKAGSGMTKRAAFATEPRPEQGAG
jgi:hypothetical protein